MFAVRNPMYPRKTTNSIRTNPAQNNFQELVRFSQKKADQSF
jgi:hypothetical protein